MVDGVNKSGGNYIPVGNEVDGNKQVQGQGASGGRHEIDAKQIASLEQLLGSNGSRSLENRLLAGSGDKDVKDLKGLGQQLGNVSSDRVSADIYSFMALFQKLAQEMRNSNREVRTQELQGQISELKNAAQEMRNAAEKRFAAAITQGALQIAGGVAQIGMSGASLASTVKGIKMEQQSQNAMNVSKTLDNTPANAELRSDLRTQSAAWGAQGKTFQARGANYNQLAQGTSQTLGGLGGIIAGSLNREADIMDAKRSEAETRSKEHEINVQHANDMMQQMMDVIRDVRDKLASIDQSRLETNRGIARNV